METQLETAETYKLTSEVDNENVVEFPQHLTNVY